MRLRLRPPVLTLAQRSRLGADMQQILDAPYGTVIDTVLDELAAAGFLRREAGFWGGVQPAPRARELNGFEVSQIEGHDERAERRDAELRADRDAVRATLNTDQLTAAATKALLHLDSSLIGTPDYMGVAYFGAYEYRDLRALTYEHRRRVHHALLAAGLPVDGESDAHAAIIYEGDE